MVLMGMENGMIDSVVCQSGGMLPMRVAEAMVLQANGHRGKALRKLIRGIMRMKNSLDKENKWCYCIGATGRDAATRW